jgi:hypothetical protein
MKSVLNRLAALTCAGAMVACVSSANQAIRDLNPESAAHSIQPALSGKADVARVLGPARTNTFDSGYEVWTYRYIERAPKMWSPAPAGGGTIKGSVESLRELVIVFNPAGVVTKYRLSPVVPED